MRQVSPRILKYLEVGSFSQFCCRFVTFFKYLKNIVDYEGGEAV